MIQIDDAELKRVMQEVIDKFLIPKFNELGMNASGKWIDSLQAEAVNGTGYIKGQFYSYWLQNGRAGGTKPPFNAIFQWVGVKLGLTGAQQTGATFAIMQKIENEGTDYYPQGTELLTVLESTEVQQYIYTSLRAGINGKLKVEIEKRFKKTLITQ